MILKIFKCSASISNSKVEKAIVSLFRDYAITCGPSAETIDMNYILSKEVDEDITIGDILAYTVNVITITKDGEIVQVSIPDNVIYKGCNLSSLLKLIKYGNFEVRGLDVIDDAFDYVLSNM